MLSFNTLQDKTAENNINRRKTVTTKIYMQDISRPIFLPLCLQMLGIRRTI